MAYASYRCQIQAPSVQVWNFLCASAQEQGPLRVGAFAASAHASQALSAAALPCAEDLVLHQETKELIFALREGQPIQGVRRFRLVQDASKPYPYLEALLDWRCLDKDKERELLPLLESLTRDLALFAKKELESGAA